MKASKLVACPVCGSCQFSFSPVLWSELISEWQLSEHEVGYINLQQGYHCVGCGSSLRSMALAAALLAEAKMDKSLSWAIVSGALDGCRILEINEAGHLTKYLKQINGYRYVQYPEYDMTNLALDDGQFDVVIHSDTLEHVANPVRALSECRRVLAPDGKCLFTVPAVVDRFTRFRNGLIPSYHGRPGDLDQCMLVYTEFGVDTWKYVIAAGFSSVEIHALDYPAGLAYVGKK